MNERSKKISSYVKQTRKAKKFTIKYVVDNCKLSRSYLNMIECGINSSTQKPISPTLDTIEELCLGLDVTTFDFLNAIDFIDAKEQDPLLNYQESLHEILNYSFNNKQIDFENIDEDTQNRIVNSINEFIQFQIYSYLNNK